MNDFPAFPGEKAYRFGQTNDCNEGMTLRDYFAAKAMPEAIRHQLDARAATIKPNAAFEFELVAISAYKMADAMLAERAK